MRKSKGQAPQKNKPGAVRRPPRERRLILLDQEPLRRETSSECRQAMVRLEKARAEWKRYEREDKPAFERWMAGTFGVLMTRIREAVARVREKETLVHEVEMEMLVSGARNERAAFARVQRRRTAPPAAADFESSGPPPPPEEDEEEAMDEFEQELLFAEVLGMMGMNPDRMSEKQYEKMFADFKANFLEDPPPEPPPMHVPQPAAPKNEQGRIKEIYRVLVRRLHPDARADSDPEVSALWHEVQEAYGDGNLERLEMLLALTDIQSNTTGGHTTLSQLRAVLAELRSAFNALQRNLRAARKEPAWDFVRVKNRAALEKRLRRELESELAGREDDLSRLEALIAGWSAPPKARKKPRKPERRTQDFFPF
jgi:hypothetical protein